MKSLFVALLLALSGSAIAEANEAPVSKEIPTTEKEFVATINGFDKAQIIEQLGEPSNMNDITNAKTGKLEASIWHYHNINTDEKGEYYKTTELDFIDDRVVLVVFMNNTDESTSYDLKKDTELPKPNM
ncbi:MAG: hypothetical protein ACXW1P_05670 [Methylophilaceae bacterium]